jgi:gliding motility-associated-like protein
MKTRHFSLLFFLFVAQVAVAQNQWTWMAGDKSANNNGIYGTLGAPNSSNSPGSRAGASYWTDKQGNLWMFGGRGRGENPLAGLLNDLWKYNPDNNLWTWMGGDKNIMAWGTYGNQGNAAPGNQPGARQDAVSWTDDEGNFWLFGGSGLATLPIIEGLLNDLWMYSPSTNQWTWVSGTNNLDQIGQYGDHGDDNSESYYPGGRSMATGWKDDNGNLWLFGGYGYSSKNRISDLNDVWRYSPSNNNWRWMNGDKSQRARVHYGQKGEFSNDNTPGGRQGSVGWTDKRGRFWLFGGGDDRSEFYSDLWQYDPDDNEWAWMSGSKNTNLEPQFSEKGVPDPDGNPGSRMLASGWVDADGELWLFGGTGYGGRSGEDPLNNLWRYSIDNDEWTFVKGDISNPSAVYGTKGAGAPGNQPGGISNAARWKDKEGNFWIFGGNAAGGDLNQTWKFSFNCDANVSGTISPATASICEGGSQVLTATGGTSYEWRRYDVVIPGQTKAKYTATQPGKYSVYIKNGSCVGPASNTVEITLATAPTGTVSPASASVCEGSSQVLTATGGTSYEWSRNNVIIAGQTKATFAATQPGTYSVIIKNGTCVGPASNTAVITLTAAPTGTISPASASVCEGSSQVLTATGGTSYEWRRDGITINGETTATLTVIDPGTYSVIIKNGNCSREASNTSVISLSSVAGSRYEDVKVTANVPTRLSARPAGVSYEWIPATGLDDPASPTPMVTINTNVQYLVRITPTEGCEIVDTLQVRIGIAEIKKVIVPTAFTPNGNNVNDRLRPMIKLSAIEYFRIYNRWGNLVFQTNETATGWDGRYKGVLQPSDTYTWILSAVTPNGEPIKQSGKTLLIR